MTKLPSPDTIIEMARLAGVGIDAEIAQRVARTIGPALDGFAPTAADLQFDLEPAGFVRAQRRGAKA